MRSGRGLVSGSTKGSHLLLAMPEGMHSQENKIMATRAQFTNQIEGQSHSIIPLPFRLT